MADLIDDVRREASQHLALRVKAEIERLQEAKRAALAIADERAKENVELRAALQRIVDEADSDDGLTAWDGSDIARAALQ